MVEYWPLRLVRSRTPGFHPGNTGSNRVGVTINFPFFFNDLGHSKGTKFQWRAQERNREPVMITSCLISILPHISNTSYQDN